MFDVTETKPDQNLAHDADVTPSLTGETREGLRIAVVDDDEKEFFLLRYILEKGRGDVDAITHYFGLDGLLRDDVQSPDVVILDRYIPDAGLMEDRIRIIRARHNNCGVVMYTGKMTPSLRTTATHEGAVAVVEKGTLNGAELSKLIDAAAILGPAVGNARPT